MTDTCRECGRKLTAARPDRVSKTGLCVDHANKVKWTPESRAKLAAAVRARHARERADPVKMAAKVASGQRLQRDHGSTPEMVAKQSAGRSRTFWCPEAYRGLNRELKRKQIGLAERKQMIATEMLRDAHRREMAALAAERARRNAMSPFERQEERLRNGASVVTKFTPRRADPSYTLGGVVGAIA